MRSAEAAHPRAAQPGAARSNRRLGGGWRGADAWWRARGAGAGAGHVEKGKGGGCCMCKMHRGAGARAAGEKRAAAPWPIGKTERGMPDRRRHTHILWGGVCHTHACPRAARRRPLPHTSPEPTAQGLDSRASFPVRSACLVVECQARAVRSVFQRAPNPPPTTTSPCEPPVPSLPLLSLSLIWSPSPPSTRWARPPCSSSPWPARPPPYSWPAAPPRAPCRARRPPGPRPTPWGTVSVRASCCRPGGSTSWAPRRRRWGRRAGGRGGTRSPWRPPCAGSDSWRRWWRTTWLLP